MKKIFAKLKELATKIVNKAKDIWAKVKAWLNKEDDKGLSNKDKIKVWGWVSAVAACGIGFGYSVGQIKALTSTPVKNALNWYDDPESKRLRNSKFYSLSTRKIDYDHREYDDNGIFAYKFKDGNDYIDICAIQGVDAPKLSDFGAIGERVINMGYSPDQRICSGSIVFGTCNLI